MRAPRLAQSLGQGAASPPGATLTLEVCGLTASYQAPRPGPRPVLEEVSLQVAAGELVGLVGPNGSGKTTLIRAITGLVPVLAGRVLIQGHDASRLSPRDLARRAAVVPQGPQLPEAFTALEIVLLGRTPYLRLLESESAADLATARRAMLATGTWALAHRRLAELSGGERQRVVVARALAQETALLLLDEPTVHLDIGHQAAVLGLLLARCREGKGALAVVHDLTLAAQYCHRLVMLHGGRVVAQGQPEEVLRPELLEQVYGAPVEVFPHPYNGRPVVAPRASEG